MPRTQSFVYLRRVIVAIVIAVFPTALSPLLAQTFDATNLRQPTDLNGVWFVHAGDDPAFAAPAFDDSHWTPFDVGKSIKLVFPKSRPPVLWYRLHLKVSPNQPDLALLEHQIGSAFEVYENGKLLFRVGSVQPFVPHTYGARLLAAIPTEDIDTGSLIMAVRVYITPYEWGGVGPGYTASNLFIGQQSALREHMWLVTIGENALGWVVLFAGFALGLVALALFFSQPRQREYLWIFLQFFTGALSLPIIAWELFHTVPVAWDQVKLALQFGSGFFTIFMYFAIIRLRPAPWMRVFFIVSFLGGGFFFFASTQGWLNANAAQVALLPLAFFAYGVLPVLLLIHLRRGNTEAGILLIPLLFTSLAIYLQIALFILIQIPGTAARALRVATFFSGWKVGPFSVSVLGICSILFVLSLSIIIVLRSTRVSRQQAILEGEMAAAREVQQVILPEVVATVPGFRIVSVYEPAQQVGGDFYQTLPSGNGGLLVVIGDVAGKGLPAAMLVSVLVGAIRGVAEYTRDPAELLSNLNERLVGRTGNSFSTALVARIDADGAVSIANAGHLSPYLDGTEIDLPGALPLGVQSGVRYATTEFRLPAGARLTFYSDGVIEAQNQKGELLGFDRAREMSTLTAANIVKAAKQFGQEDDITVVTVERVTVADPAPYPVGGMTAAEAVS